jgi:hypothetical protein
VSHEPYQILIFGSETRTTEVGFATYLLHKGTDIKFIKDLLGHFNIKTTERYLHVTKEKLVNIKSPFDDLWEKEDILGSWKINVLQLLKIRLN